MTEKTVKKIVCAILCLCMVAAFAGCGAKEPEAAGIDVRGKLSALVTSDKELGIAGKYKALSEITDAEIDPEIVGTWLTADGKTSYTYTADGRATSKSEDYGSTEVTYGCVKIGDYKILCEEIPLDPEYYEGAEEGDTAMSYLAYAIENDVMYSVVVEEVNEDFTSSVSSLVVMYRADESGSAAAAVANNPFDIGSFAGTWESDKGSFTIEGDTLTLGEDSYKISFSDKNELVVEKDGKSVAYGMSIANSKEYDYDDRSKSTDSIVLNLSYTGADENDKPNLLAVLDDWHTEYEFENWYYAGNFSLQ